MKKLLTQCSILSMLAFCAAPPAIAMMTNEDGTDTSSHVSSSNRAAATQVNTKNLEEALATDERLWNTYRAVCQFMNNDAEKERISTPSSELQEEINSITSTIQVLETRLRNHCGNLSFYDKVSYTTWGGMDSEDKKRQKEASKKVAEIYHQRSLIRPQMKDLDSQRDNLLKRSYVLPIFSNMPLDTLIQIQDTLRDLHNRRKTLTNPDRKSAQEELIGLGISTTIDALFARYPEPDFPFPEDDPTPGE